MNFLDGYDYRINVVGVDSTIIVDSNTGFLKGCITDQEENIIVDIFNKSFYGTLVGNILNKDLETVLDLDNNKIHIDAIVSKTIFGNIINSNNNVMVDVLHNSISNVDLISADKINAEQISGNFTGDLYNSNNAVVFSSFHNSISNVDLINTEVINAKSISGNFSGNLLNERNKIIFDSKSNIISLDSIKSLNEDKALNIGTLDDPIDLNINLRSVLNLNSKIKDIENVDGITPFVINYFPRNSKDDTIDYDEVLGLFTCKGLHKSVMKPVGTIGFVVDSKSIKKTDIDSIPSYFIVKTDDDDEEDEEDEDEKVTPNSRVFNNCLTFGNQTLSAPIFKVGTHNNTDSIIAEKGMIVFNEGLKKFQGFDGSKWVDLNV